MKTSFYLILLFLGIGFWNCGPNDEQIMTDYRTACEQAMKRLGDWTPEQRVGVAFVEYDKVVSEEEQMLSSIMKKLRNDSIREAELRNLRLDMISNRFMYAWALRNVKGERMDYDTDFVAYARSIDLNDPALIQDDQGIQVCDMRLRWEQNIVSSIWPERQLVGLEILQKFVTNQQVRNKMATKLVESYLGSGGSERIKEVFTRYCELCNDQEAIARLIPRYEELTVLSEGSPAPDFEMADPQGKRCRLSDFKGKYVMIDVWATWCGPCKMEIPDFEKQHKLFADDSRIQFISISLDEDKEAWKKMLEKDKPDWKQYVVEGGVLKSEFCQKYFVSSIPRFLLIDPQGCIVSVDVMRPSDSTFTEYVRGNMES